MLLAAQELGCVYQAALIAALTQGRDLLIRKVDRSTREHREALLSDQSVSDLFLLMRAWSYASQNKFHLNACKALGLILEQADVLTKVVGRRSSLEYRSDLHQIRAHT